VVWIGADELQFSRIVSGTQSSRGFTSAIQRLQTIRYVPLATQAD